MDARASDALAEDQAGADLMSPSLLEAMETPTTPRGPICGARNPHGTPCQAKPKK